MIPQARDQAAALLARARLAVEPMEPLPEALRPANADEAYAVQHALHARLTEEGRGGIAGYKIGCTSAVMQEYLRVDHPCAGGVLAPTVHRGRARLPAGAFCRPGVECEIAVELAADLPPRDAPYARQEAAAAVARVMAAIEIVDDRWRDFTRVDPSTLTADDFFGAGCVLGEPRAVDTLADLADVAGAMQVNGETVGEGRGADVLGHPLEALAWLAGSGAAKGGLRRGQIVLLGSLVRTCWLAPGDHVAVTLEGLGRAELTLA